MADVYNFDGIATVYYFDGLGERQIMTGNNAMIVKNILHPGFPEFKHSHPHEQIVTIASGHCEFMLNGEWFPMGPGDMLFVPGNVEHDIRVIGDEDVVNYDIFSPIREDYLKQAQEAEAQKKD